MAGRQRRALLHRLLKQPKRIVQFFLIQSFHASHDQQFRLRQMRAKFLQLFQILQFLLRRAAFALCAQGNAEAVVGFFEFRLQLNGSSECSNRTRSVTTHFQFHAQVVLRLGVLGIEFHRFTKFR
jgi:hypothetical protein